MNNNYNNNNNQRRQRPRGHQNNGHNNSGPRRLNSNNNGTYSRNQTFDSNGPDMRVRGTAAQVHEKYSNAARDAQAMGDYIRAENLLQHAEHYSRIMDSIQENTAAQNEQPRVERMDNYQQPQDGMMAEHPQPSFVPPQQPQQQQSAPRQPRPRGGYVPPMPPAVVPDVQPVIEGSEVFPVESDSTHAAG